MLRRMIVFVLTVFLILGVSSLMVLAYSTSSPQPEDTGPASPPEAKALPPLGQPERSSLLDQPEPSPPPLDMEQVWTAALARDRWPALATKGKTGTSGGRIALTFDDGPDPNTTPLILDTLREHDVKATFFVVGRRVEENPELLRRILDEGHTLGNHTYSHANMPDLSPSQMRQELQDAQESVDGALGYHYPMVLMRPPYGNPYFDGSGTLPVFREVVREQGLFVVTWTMDPNDYLFADQPEGLVQEVALTDGKLGQRGANDEVLLLHDNQRQTAEALPGIIDHYESSGIGFADVRELLADKYADR